MAKNPFEGLRIGDLTSKQREVLAHVADNRTSKEIASFLGVTESAVNQRIESIRARMGGVPRAELARLYRQLCQDDETCNPLTENNIQLPDEYAFAHRGLEGPGVATQYRQGPGPHRTFSPAVAGERVVPAILDGAHGTVNRLLAITGIAVGLLAVVLVCLGVAQALNALV